MKYWNIMQPLQTVSLLIVLFLNVKDYYYSCFLKARCLDTLFLKVRMYVKMFYIPWLNSAAENLPTAQM